MKWFDALLEFCEGADPVSQIAVREMEQQAASQKTQIDNLVEQIESLNERLKLKDMENQRLRNCMSNDAKKTEEVIKNLRNLKAWLDTSSSLCHSEIHRLAEMIGLEDPKIDEDVEVTW